MIKQFLNTFTATSETTTPESKPQIDLKLSCSQALCSRTPMHVGVLGRPNL